MRKLFTFLILASALLCCGVSAADTAAQVTVSGATLNPEVFLPWDTGTITVVVTNTGTTPVSLSSARLTAPQNIDIIETPHTGSGTLGAGNSMTFTFTVSVRGEEGIFYPRFVLNFRDAGSLSYPILLRVDRTPIDAGISARPDIFMTGKKDTVVVSVGNPRQNAVSAVTITPVTGVADIVPTSVFIGTLGSGQKSNASFSVTPTGEGDLTFNVEYRNGQNRHTIPLTIPVIPGTAKRVAEPIVSNVEVSSIAGGYRITGDVSNAGLETARSVVLTTKSPAVPIDPFRVYVVGSLDADDFSSFEVTFSAEDSDEVPLVIRYRDDDGNLYEETAFVAIRSGISQVPDHDGGISPVVIGIAALCILFVAGAVLYSRKKR
jgi:voltage-gated potassium channel Kch